MKSSTEFSDSFNGNFYQDSLSIIVDFVENLGKENFQKIIKEMIEKFKFNFISESKFLDLMKK